jgi:hypothetical protein
LFIDPGVVMGPGAVAVPGVENGLVPVVCAFAGAIANAASAIVERSIVMRIMCVSFVWIVVIGG